MLSGQFLGKIAFVLGLMALGSALAGWPESRLGRGDRILIGAAIVVGTLHYVVQMPDLASAGLTRERCIDRRGTGAAPTESRSRVAFDV